MGALSLRLGEFYGSSGSSGASPTFDVRLMRATGCEADVQLHGHDDAHFVLALAGVYRSSAAKAPEFARAPFLVFNPPETTHRDRFLNGAGMFMTVSMSRADFRLARECESLPGSAVALQHSSAVRTAFSVARSIRAQCPAEIEFSSWDLFAEPTIQPSNWRVPPRWAHLAYDALMDEAVNSELSVAHLARVAGVHPVHLARVFRASWGQSPAEMLRWRRADKAVDLLSRTRRAPAEIAAAVGYVDQSHMCRSLRDMFGVTPGQCRDGKLRRYNTRRLDRQ